MRLTGNQMQAIRQFAADIAGEQARVFGSRLDDAARGGKTRQRLQFLARVIRKECRHLETTDGRLFAQPFTVERARSLETDADLAERVEAFVGRFGRLQDAVGDKLCFRVLPEIRIN